MNLRIVSVVTKKEMRDLLRDRRTLISMILIPVISLPLLIMGATWVSMRSINKLQEQELSVAVLGAERDLGMVASLEEQDGRFRFWTADDLGLPVDSLLAREDTRIVLEFGEGLEGALDRLDQPELEGEAPSVRLYYDSTGDEAKLGGRELRQRLEGIREVRLGSWLQEKNLRADLTRPWEVEHVETAPPRKQAAEMVARFMPYMILILCLQGAMYPAMDLTAGEKERSTIETLLVNPVTRFDIIMGKYLATSVMAVGSAVFTMGGQFLFFQIFAERMTKGLFQIHMDPTATLVGLALLLPVAMTFSALLLAISTYARSMKEAQSYLGPLMMLVIFPAMISMIPGITLNVGLAFVPVVNVTLLIKDVLLQDYGQWGLMLLVFGVNFVYAGLALAVAQYVFRQEAVIFRS